MPLAKGDTTHRWIRRRWVSTSKLARSWISVAQISTTIGFYPIKTKHWKRAGSNVTNFRYVFLLTGACWTTTATRLPPMRLDSASLRWRGKGLIAAALPIWALRQRRRAAQRPLLATAKPIAVKKNFHPAGKNTKVFYLSFFQYNWGFQFKIIEGCTFSDDDGPYYWHIKSGTIQREPPENKDSCSQPAMNFQRQVVREAEVSVSTQHLCMLNIIRHSILDIPLQAISASFTPVVPRSTTSFTLSDLDSMRSKEDMAFK